jgi:hypothetical protein
MSPSHHFYLLIDLVCIHCTLRSICFHRGPSQFLLVIGLFQLVKDLLAAPSQCSPRTEPVAIAMEPETEPKNGAQERSPRTEVALEPENGPRRTVPITDLTMEVAMEPENRASERSLSRISPWSPKMEPENGGRHGARERGKLNGGPSQCPQAWSSPWREGPETTIKPSLTHASQARACPPLID